MREDPTDRARARRAGRRRLAVAAALAAAAMRASPAAAEWRLAVSVWVVEGERLLRGPVVFTVGVYAGADPREGEVPLLERSFSRTLADGRLADSATGPELPRVFDGLRGGARPWIQVSVNGRRLLPRGRAGNEVFAAITGDAAAPAVLLLPDCSVVGSVGFQASGAAPGPAADRGAPAGRSAVRAGLIVDAAPDAPAPVGLPAGVPPAGAAAAPPVTLQPVAASDPATGVLLPEVAGAGIEDPEAAVPAPPPSIRMALPEPAGPPARPAAPLFPPPERNGLLDLR